MSGTTSVQKREAPAPRLLTGYGHWIVEDPVEERAVGSTPNEGEVRGELVRLVDGRRVSTPNLQSQKTDVLTSFLRRLSECVHFIGRALHD